ncbi:adenosylmethionine--8-amino-7-oxononanoate transaminase [Salegentibacter sp. F188]|uniref:Adenosylmethionine-8-amino-7-oxononanoate aminotransferase n=1 Tax=Autumnicola patrickiae TaxID=3075591 RepID=A0ABU3E417_9FLAO|nr:adenosylmethionine--8-amino-7-oxononanoate transaminase [Salegentibacter sp. F188]MDT0690738.1 adenosylmethionine--8-amino-7-oxononanoate transaminase [Salegentibacter sp. F188]
MADLKQNIEEQNLSERDKKHLWHPLTQHKISPEMLAIEKAKGAKLYDEAGKEYIDGIASWYTCMYGHCNEFITSRVAEQMQKLDQVVFSGFTHRPAVELSEALMKILPANQQKLFFNDNGSTATEIGIKMALQYHHNQGNDRKVMLAFEDGFHGDTFGAMSVSGLSVYNGAFEDHFIEVVRIPTPDGTNNSAVIDKLKKLISENNLAGFIYEPLVQGAAAMKMYDAEGLEQILQICKQHEIICIADEVMTGFGKTGKYFASDYLEAQPDIVCMSKALTAGLLPMGLTSCTQAVYDAFYSDDIAKGLFHGHTYSANPLACTAALAGIELLTSKDIQEDISRVIKSHQDFNARIKDHPKVTNARQLGVIYAFELNVKMERYGNLRNQLFKHFMDGGIFLRPLGNTVYILAPYIISNEELNKIYSSVEEVLEKFGN